MNEAQKRDPAAEHFEIYQGYEKSLKQWLVAYGIGGPVLLATQATITATLVQAGTMGTVAWLFIAGVAAQILITLPNKWVNWILYSYDGASRRWEVNLFRTADWISEQFWIDILVDITSVVTFGIATRLVLCATC